MFTQDVIFIVIVALTALSATTAVLIAVFGDTRRNPGRRMVAEKFAQIALLAATAIVSLLVLP